MSHILDSGSARLVGKPHTSESRVTGRVLRSLRCTRRRVGIGKSNGGAVGETIIRTFVSQFYLFRNA